MSARDLSRVPRGSLRPRQLAGVVRFELGRNLFSRRALASYFLAFLPVPLLLIWAFVVATQDPMQSAPSAFAAIFVIYLRASIFLSSLFVFVSLFRSDILEKSLHYYYLTPIRRELLVLGKYLAGLIATAGTFVFSISLIFVLFRLHWGFGDLGHYMFSQGGLGHLLSYLAIGILACLGYGSVFLLFGLFFRNPIVPAAVFWAWEFINFLLPSLLKKISVIHYLKSLYPVPLPEGMFAIIAEPTSPWVSVPGLLIFTLAVLAIAGWRARRMDVSYGAD